MALFHQFAEDLEQQLSEPIPDSVKADPVAYEAFIRTHFERHLADSSSQIGQRMQQTLDTNRSLNERAGRPLRLPRPREADEPGTRTSHADRRRRRRPGQRAAARQRPRRPRRQRPRLMASHPIVSIVSVRVSVVSWRGKNSLLPRDAHTTKNRHVGRSCRSWLGRGRVAGCPRRGLAQAQRRDVGVGLGVERVLALVLRVVLRVEGSVEHVTRRRARKRVVGAEA